MAENNNLVHAQMVQQDATYRELLEKLKTHVHQLTLQTDAMSCVKWIQKLQTLTDADDIKLRNYLLLQICNQMRSGYLDHPFVNASYLDQDLKVVANCCREWEAMCNTTDDILKMRLKRSVSNTTDVCTDICTSDIDATVNSEVNRSLAIRNAFNSETNGWGETKKRFTKPFEIGWQRQNFYQRKYEETLSELKEVKLKLYLKDTRSLEALVECLGVNFIERYQNATDELLALEKMTDTRKELLAFKLNFCNRFNTICGELLNGNMTENLLRCEEHFQFTFNRILCNLMDNNENRKELVSTDRATISTDLDVGNTKYSDYLKRYIKKQQKQYKRKMQDCERQISALKNEISLRDKKQSRQIIEMKCENIIKNEQKTRDQLSESVNELESKYKNIVQQIFSELQEQS